MGSNKQQRKKKQNNGYFTRNTQQYGPNFLTRKTAKDIRRDFNNICKDLAHSDPENDIQRLVPYFNNFTFLSNLIECANEEASAANATYIGLQTYIAQAQRGEVYIDPSTNLFERMTLALNQSCAYQIVLMHLNNIVSLLNCTAEESLLYPAIEMQLKSLSLQLSSYRRIF